MDVMGSEEYQQREEVPTRKFIHTQDRDPISIQPDVVKMPLISP